MKSEDKPRQCVEQQIHHSADKGNIKDMLFLVNWTIKKAECQRIDAFELWCWRRLLRVPWTARRSNQSIFFFFFFQTSQSQGKSALNAHWKDWYWSWNSSILVIWCEQLTHWKIPWCWEWLGAEGKEGVRDEMAGWHHWCSGHELGQTSGDSEGQRGLACCSPWGCKELDMTGWLDNNEIKYSE